MMLGTLGNRAVFRVRADKIQGGILGFRTPFALGRSSVKASFVEDSLGSGPLLYTALHGRCLFERLE